MPWFNGIIAGVNLWLMWSVWRGREQRSPGQFCLMLAVTFGFSAALLGLLTWNARQAGFPHLGGLLDTAALVLAVAQLGFLVGALLQLATFFEAWRVLSSCRFCGAWGRKRFHFSGVSSKTYLEEAEILGGPTEAKWDVHAWTCGSCKVADFTFRGTQFHPGDVERYNKELTGGADDGPEEHLRAV